MPSIEPRAAARETSYTVDNPDLTQTVCHAIVALEGYADVARWHRDRAMKRGLALHRGTRALSGAAERCDEFAGNLLHLVASNYEFGIADLPWLNNAFDKARRSLSSVNRSLERDYHSHAAAIGHDNFECPEFDQLYEFENMDSMFLARDGVAVAAQAIQFSLDGTLDPIRCRLMVAEQLAWTNAKLREAVV